MSNLAIATLICGSVLLFLLVRDAARAALEIKVAA
jgi:hypothetical protein